MKVKIVTNKSEPIGIEYPRLMIDKEDIENNSKNPLIVLFVNENQGIVISAHPDDLVGYRENELNGDFDWGDSVCCVNFVPFIGEITLTGE